jgi:hypothetical protein
MREYDSDLGAGGQTVNCLWPVTDVLLLKILGLKCSCALCLRVNSDTRYARQKFMFVYLVRTALNFDFGLVIN